MKIIYSFWTKPFYQKNAVGGYSNGWQGRELISEENAVKAMERNITYYKLSSSFFKKAGYNVELFTDKKGEELIGENTFDNIHTDLEELKDEPAELWSIAKIFSLEKSLKNNKSPCIHIDHDVFFKNIEKIKKTIEPTDWHLIVQSKEINEHYYRIYDKSLELFCSLFQIDPLASRLLRTYNYVYNCGFLGFKNEKIGKFYFKPYYDLYNKVIKNKDKLNKYIRFRAICQGNPTLNLANANINCLIEQVLLTQVANYYNFYVKEVLPISTWGGDPTKNIIKFNLHFGYLHASGNYKYLDDDKYEAIIKEFK